MAWIYLAESEDSLKPWKGTSDQSPIVKMTDTLKPFFFLGCGQEVYQTLQSGTMSEHFRLIYQPEESTLSTEDSHARTLALPAAAKAWQESEAAYSSRSLGLSAKYDPDSSSWRTFQLSLFEEQNELLANFAASGMTVDGGFYPLQMWARITDENDGGYLPTPRETDGSGGAAKQRVLGVLGLNDKRFQLREWVRAWPTPRANKTGGYASPGYSPTLEQAVRWPTPRAVDGSKGIRTPEGCAKERLRCKNGQDLPTEVGGQLNPTWVEWLMGYPSEWTVLEDWAMQWYRPKRGKPLKG